MRLPTDLKPPGSPPYIPPSSIFEPVDALLYLMGRGRSSYSSASLAKPGWHNLSDPAELLQSGKSREDASGCAESRPKRHRLLLSHSNAPVVVPGPVVSEILDVPEQTKAGLMPRASKRYHPLHRVHGHSSCLPKDPRTIVSSDNIRLVDQDKPPTRPTFVATISPRPGGQGSKPLLSTPLPGNLDKLTPLFDQHSKASLSQADVKRGWGDLGLLGEFPTIPGPKGFPAHGQAHDDILSPTDELPQYTLGSYKIAGVLLDDSNHADGSIQSSPQTGAMGRDRIILPHIDTSCALETCETRYAMSPADESVFTSEVVQPHQEARGAKTVDALLNTLPKVEDSIISFPALIRLTHKAYQTSKTHPPGSQNTYFDLCIVTNPQDNTIRVWNVLVDDSILSRCRENNPQLCLPSVDSPAPPFGKPQCLSAALDHPSRAQVSRFWLSVNKLPSDTPAPGELSKTRLIAHNTLPQEHELIPTPPGLEMNRDSLHKLSPLVRALQGLAPISFEPRPLRLIRSSHIGSFVHDCLPNLKRDDLDCHKIMDSPNVPSCGAGHFNRLVDAKRAETSEHPGDIDYSPLPANAVCASDNNSFVLDLGGCSHEPCNISRSSIHKNEHDGPQPTPFKESILVGATNAPTGPPYKPKCTSTALAPTTTNHLQGADWVVKVDEGEEGGIGFEPPTQTKIFEPWETGDRAEQAGEHSLGAGRAGWKQENRRDHEGALPRDVMGVPVQRCRSMPHRQCRPRRTKLGSRASLPFCRYHPFYPRIPPGLQSVKRHSGNSDPPPGQHGAPLSPFDFNTLGFPFNNSFGSVDGESPWSGGDPGLGLLPAPELNIVPLQVFFGQEPAPNIASPQPQHRGEGDPAVQQRTNAPPPPVPLSTETQLGARGPTWNAGFVTGCGFATRQSGRSLPQLHVNDPEWNAGFVAGCVLVAGASGKSLPLPHKWGPEWNAGFIIGCTFASQTSGGPHADESWSQPNLIETVTQVAPPAAMDTFANGDTQIRQPAVALDNPIAPPLLPDTPQSLGAQTVNDLPHDRPASSPTQIATERSKSDDTQIGTALVPREAAPGANDNTLEIPAEQTLQHGHDKKKHRCSVCTKAFHKKYRLEDHIHTHRNQAKGMRYLYPLLTYTNFLGRI
ncbi:unnamed protein product [Rhizoctonia solani]|uniref:C2H2-type domain-containing protein n=1 Tax=Rhizoctonia solani TaxID=456999 RepID=A0A8H3DHR4_9AGAM|nr:unnamed protein product [Rhizoctonia solani]